MSITNLLMTSSAIQRSFIAKSTEVSKEKLLKPDLGVFSKDIVEISTLGLERQQKEIQVGASKSIEEIANEVVKVSSSIGRASSIRNLTNHQASSLYNKIAGLL